MNPLAIISVAGTVIDLVSKAGNAVPDVLRAYNSVKNLFAKDPKLVTQADLDAVIAENNDLYTRIQQPLEPEED